MTLLAATTSGLDGIGVVVVLAALVLTVTWIVFPFVVMNGFSRLRFQNRTVIETLEAIQKELRTLNDRELQTHKLLREISGHAKAANEMHGDLNRAAQWFVDRESAGPHTDHEE